MLATVSFRSIVLFRELTVLILMFLLALFAIVAVGAFLHSVFCCAALVYCDWRRSGGQIVHSGTFDVFAVGFVCVASRIAQRGWLLRLLTRARRQSSECSSFD